MIKSGSPENATSSICTPTSNGLYALAGTVEECSDTSLCYEIQGVNVTELFPEWQSRLYPNPSQGTLWVELMETSQAILRVYNAFGQLTSTHNLIRQRERIDLGTTSGVYFVEVSSGSGTQRATVILE